MLTDKHGRLIPIEDIVSAPIHDTHGHVAGAVLVFRDVRQERQVQEALRSSEEHYRSVAETASDAIITIDENSIIVFATRACEKIFGYTPEEVTGKNLTMLMPPAFRQAHLATYPHYLKTGEKRVDWSGVELPGLHRGQAWGYAAGSEIQIAVRDSGSWMDPRWCNDWWPSCP